MIVWAIFWLSIALIILGAATFAKYDEDLGVVEAVVGVIFTAITGFIILGFMISGFSSRGDLHSKVVEIQAKTATKDNLVKLLQSQLDEYPNFAKDVGSALDAKVIIAVYPELGKDVYLDKTRQIVALNVEINGIRNDYYGLQADICADQNNPMVPKTVWYPHCGITNWNNLKLPDLSPVVAG